MGYPSDTWIIIPAHNEEKQIGAVLEELIAYPYCILVVDDGSSDRTSQEALRFPVTVLRHMINLGQGAALQSGFQYALRFPETRYLVTFDADGQHRADDIPPMVEICRSGKAEVVLGSRFLPGGQANDIHFSRKLALKIAILFTNLTTGLSLTDTHNGLRVISSRAAASIYLTQNGMAHASELLAQIAAQKISYCEVPVSVTYTPYSRKKGQPLLNGVNILWDFLEGMNR